ncbi:MAG: hypothetical protein A2138_17055 [Deltaproteobacteria bacterium RBG_16_71_12]|nr:MAG: hypothetical protein A2138_17055 [Deltaproteobacteria bacterium RBG_16_71_12]
MLAERRVFVDGLRDPHRRTVAALELPGLDTGERDPHRQQRVVGKDTERCRPREPQAVTTRGAR